MEQINEPHAFESDLSGVRYVPRPPVRASLLQAVVGLNRCQHPQQAASVSRRHAEKIAQQNSARNASHLFGGRAADSPELKANPEHVVRRATKSHQTQEDAVARSGGARATVGRVHRPTPCYMRYVFPPLIRLLNRLSISAQRVCDGFGSEASGEGISRQR